eukprot:5287449-Ditylum_brightwellii.AAC.2
MADGLKRTHVLKLLKIGYGQKQAGRVWYNHLKKGLLDIGFIQSGMDECIFYCDKTVFLCYVDGGIFASPNQEDIDKAIIDLSNVNFDIEDKGNVKDYLGMTI